MNNGEFLNLAADYLNGVLPPDETTNFECELAANPAKQQQLANMRALRDALTLQVVTESAAAWRQMQTRLQTEVTPSDISAPWLNGPKGRR